MVEILNDDISASSPLGLCDVLSCLSEKFIVDFANGIDVARDHIHVQQTRTGYFARLYDGLTGHGSRRQADINSRLTDGVEGALLWLTELTGDVARSHLALARVNERLATLHTATAKLSHYAADTRNQLEKLTRVLDARIDRMDAELTRIAAEQRAERQLNQVFNRWAAGRLSRFSVAGRCYATLEELRWGAFGDFCRTTVDRQTRQEFLDDLMNRAIKQCAADVALESPLHRVSATTWITHPRGLEENAETRAALSYLGDWSAPVTQPFVFTVSQLPDALPMRMPRLCSSKRVVEAMVCEVFEQA